jgi:hypothetical protein
MAEERWTTELAERLVKTLHKQMEQFNIQKEERIKAERKRIIEEIVVKQKESINITRHALVAVILFILGIAAWPIAWGIPNLNYAWLLCLLIGAPLFAGASGATIRIVVDWIQGKEQAVGQSVIRNGALGFIIGGISALLFVLAQVFANPTDLEATIKAEQLGRLIPFVISIGFIAGLTLEAVYKRLRETPVVDTSPIEPTKKVSPANVG